MIIAAPFGLVGVVSSGPQILVGTTEEYTGSASFFDPGKMWYVGAGYNAVASGSAAKAYFRVSDWWTATALVLWVANSSGTLLGTTGAIASSAGTGWVSATFSSQPSIVQGQTYYLGFFANNYLIPYHSGVTWEVKGRTATYPTTTNISPGTDDDSALQTFSMYLES